MSKKDTITKEYMNDNAVFSDILNFAVFHGVPKIKPENLHEMDPVETSIPTGAAGRLLTVQKIRDLLKVCEGEEMFALITAIENQSEIHYAMPVRCMMYDALQYSDQVAAAAKMHRAEEKDKSRSGRKRSEEDKNHSGSEWSEKTDNHSEPEWSEKKAEASVSASKYTKEKKETVRLQAVTRQEFLSGFFRTDKLLPVLTQSGMREVFLFMKYAKEKDRLREILRKDPRVLQLDYETARLISVVTGTKINFTGKENVDMCKAIDDMIQDGRKEGEAIGKEIGKEISKELGQTRHLVSQIITKLKKQLPAVQIADHLEEEVSRIQQILNVAAKYAPDYQVDLIVDEIMTMA